MRTRLLGRLLPLAGLAIALAPLGCVAPPDGVGDDVGAVGLALQVAPGITLGSVAYSITGPSGFSRSGAFDTSHGTIVSGLVSGLPAGTGFSIVLSATAAEGNAQCGGSASFGVTGHTTTAVMVHLLCHEAPRTGTAFISGTLNVCPTPDGLSANPGEVLVGSAIALSATAHDLDGMPAALTYHWTVSAGVLSDAGAQSPTLTCTVTGAVTVAVSVSDGDCSDTLSTTVTCTGATTDAAAGTTGSDAAPDTAGSDAAAGTAGSDAAAGTTGSDAAAGTGAAGTSGFGGSPSSPVVINEVESNGDPVGDWVELYNTGATSVDISGWKLKDNDDTHAFYVLPLGTIVAPGGFYVMNVADFVFGLGAADSTRLWDAASNPVDSFSWTSHATTTYGRCPDGTGTFITTGSSTKGAANDCGGSADGGAAGTGAAGADGGAGTGATGGADGGVGVFPWPGTDPVVTVDELNTFGTNLSGLNYQPAAGAAPAVLWAIQNGPSKLYRLLWNGSTWTSDPSNLWGAGKLIHYTTGLGGPDSEGVSKAEWTDSAIYVSTERDNTNNGVSRLSILRFDTAAVGTELTATNDWNVTADLPVVGPNLGLEAITYVPDTALVSGGFFDEATHAPYSPATYPNHGTGLFFVGLEGNGSVYGYALDHVTNAFTRVATFASGQVSIMDLAYDREVGTLWGYCDDTCGNKATVFRIDGTATSPTIGRFQVSRVFDHPSTLPSSNFEGITFAPEAECVGGQKAFFWSDDNQLDGHAIRRGSIPCGSFF